MTDNAIRGEGFDSAEGGFATIRVGDRTISKENLIRLLSAEPSKGVFLHLFHGRDRADEDMEDWGFDGPVIGPLQYVHTTYQCDVKFSCSKEVARQFFTAEEVYSFDDDEVEGRIVLNEGLIPLGGKFYGDWSVFGYDCVAQNPDGTWRAL